MLRIGIIGAGTIARAHLTALQTLEDVYVVAISDPVRERAAALARPLGATAYDDYRYVVEQAQVIWICTPPTTHCEQIIAAAQAGRHIMTEKPLATTSEDGVAIVKAVEDAGVKAIVDFNIRFEWPSQNLKAMIDADLLGDVLSIWSHRIDDGPPHHTWRHDPRFACGMTIESLCHDIDQIRWMAGPITGVIGTVAATLPELPMFDNMLSAILYLKRSGSGQLHASWVSAVTSNQMGIIGTKGTALIDYTGRANGLWIRWRTNDMEAEEVIQMEGPEATAKGYRAMASYFIDCIRNDRQPQPTVRDGLAALEVSLALLRSARERRVILVEPRAVGDMPEPAALRGLSPADTGRTEGLVS